VDISRHRRPSGKDCHASEHHEVGRLVSAEDQRFELYWPTHLSEAERRDLLSLYDEVARHEETHGYAGSLTNEVGRNIVDADAEALAEGRIHMLLARDVDGLAGSLILEQCTSQSRKHTMNAKRAVIARRARGKLLDQAVAEAVNKAVALGVEVVTCDVAADGPVELWKSLGFKEYGVLPDYARRHGRSLDGHFLYCV
jgi:predicted GNAT superfamily acetyltransferase